jgi:hypothetical protein
MEQQVNIKTATIFQIFVNIKLILVWMQSGTFLPHPMAKAFAME